MTKHYDIALIGGGASGLSLLYAMHLQGILGDYRILVLEPEAKNDNDRTWCFWTDKSDPAWQMFSSTISKSWKYNFSASKPKENMAPYQYVQIRSKDFYAFVKDVLGEYPKIEYRTEKVKQVKQGPNLQLICDSESQFSASLVFDSRPPRLEDPELIWQSFVGYRIKSPQNQFDTEVCRLMDFAVPQKNGLQFMYWLPTSVDEGLVEFTRFGDEILNEKESKPIIENYLKALGIEEWEILEKEINKIPMTLSLNSKFSYHPKSANYIPIGVRAGAVKASTGFAFKNIMDHSWEIAKALKRNEALPLPRQSAKHNYYDELLLNLFQKRDSPILKIFIRLFEKHPIDRILRFLDEKSSFREDFLIMYKMPWKPFFWSIGRSLLK